MSYIGTTANQDIVANIKEYVATAGQTVFPVIYDNYAEVSLNGTQLSSSDYTMNNGISVTLAVGATAGDIVQCTGYESFKYNNTVDTLTNQSVDGVKTFVKSPVIPNAVGANEPLSKQQLLAEIKAVDGAGSGLDADTVDGVQGALLGVGGAGYAWVNETANRVAGVTYTNNTGKPIMVNVVSYISGNTARIVMYVDSFLIGGVTTVNTIAANYVFASAIVPNGSTYSIGLAVGNLTWFELK